MVRRSLTLAFQGRQERQPAQGGGVARLVERVLALQGADDLDAEDDRDLQAGVVVGVAGGEQPVVGAPWLQRLERFDLTVDGSQDQAVQLGIEIGILILHSNILPREMFSRGEYRRFLEASNGAEGRRLSSPRQRPAGLAP